MCVKRENVKLRTILGYNDPVLFTTRSICYACERAFRHIPLVSRLLGTECGVGQAVHVLCICLVRSAVLVDHAE